MTGSVVPFNSSASSPSATCTRACRAKASPARSCISVVMATRQPLSTPPTTLSAGIRASSMNSSLNSASPVICTSGRTSTPSCSMSMRKYVSPRCLGASGFVRASSMHHFDWCANVVHTFWPVTTYSSPSRTALVFSDARSEPDSGSLKPWHHISSADRIGARKRSFCSSVPWPITVGPPIVSPSTLAICGARARAISSKKIACSIIVAPAPPKSVGQVRPAQPRSLSLRCQSRRKANDSSSELGSRPGWFSAIQCRTESRNSSSAGDNVRSTARGCYATRGDVDATEDENQAGDGGNGDRLIAEHGAIEQRDARREVADERGAAGADLGDQLVVDDERERGAEHAEHDQRGGGAERRRVARLGGDRDRQRHHAGHGDRDERGLHRRQVPVAALHDERRQPVEGGRTDHRERAEELAGRADRLDADNHRDAEQAETHAEPLAAVDAL